MRRLLVAALALASLTGTARAAGVDFGGATVIFSRGDALYRTDPVGRGEILVAKLPAGTSVRALRTDERGAILLANLGGKWAWMPLDGKANALRELPCGDGPAQLASDGAYIICRSASAIDASTLIALATGKTYAIPYPAAGIRLAGTGAQRRIIWADKEGVWSAAVASYTKKTRIAPDAPLRGFLPSPDGTHAVGVFPGELHQGKATTPAEMTFTFALDGVGARRKTIKSAVGAEWSHDSSWMLLQDRGSACIVKAGGGQYKCWRGFTAASIASDGSYALLLGSRDRAAPPPPKKLSKKDRKKKKGKKQRPVIVEPDPQQEPAGEAENANDDEDDADDVEVPPPSGPLALYRAQVDGAYTTFPTRIVQAIDGSAVWIPAPPAGESAE